MFEVAPSCSVRRACWSPVGYKLLHVTLTIKAAAVAIIAVLIIAIWVGNGRNGSSLPSSAVHPQISHALVPHYAFARLCGNEICYPCLASLSGSGTEPTVVVGDILHHLAIDSGDTHGIDYPCPCPGIHIAESIHTRSHRLGDLLTERRVLFEDDGTKVLDVFSL